VPVPHAVVVTASWDPKTSTFTDAETGEHWIYADPNTYDNPYAQQGPVYTSGPQPAPPPAVPPPVPDQALPGGPAAPEAAPGPAERPPEPGELGIVGRRSWKTWQVLVAVVVAMVLGMAINGKTGNASASSGKAAYTLPPPAGSPTTTAPGGAPPTTTTAAPGANGATSTTTASGANGATSTTTASASTSTTTAGASTSTTVAAGPATVLIPATQLSGNWTSPTFTIAAGQWNIGWAFQCTPAPAATPTFQIFVVTPGAAPAGTPAVSSSAASGQSVTPQSSLGSQQIVVEATAACRWAVKVTGFSG